MPSLKTLQRCLLSLAITGAFAGGSALQAQQVSTDYDHNANFERYHTFSFYKVQTANPLFEQRVKDEITRDLQGRGWQMVPSGGDVSITAIGDVNNTQEYTTFYNGLGGGGFGWRGWGGWGGGWGGREVTTTAQNIPVGTLIVDLYDTSTHNLVFRGRATSQLHEKHTEKNIALVNKSVDKMFDHFPPKGR